MKTPYQYLIISSEFTTTIRNGLIQKLQNGHLLPIDSSDQEKQPMKIRDQELMNKKEKLQKASMSAQSIIQPKFHRSVSEQEAIGKRDSIHQDLEPIDLPVISVMSILASLVKACTLCQSTNHRCLRLIQFQKEQMFKKVPPD